LQIAPHFRRALVAQSRIFFERLSHDPFKFYRSRSIKAQRPLRHAVDEGVEEGCGCVSLKWQNSSRHFIEYDSEREKIRTEIERPAQGLLRGHIRDRAHRGPGTSKPLRSLCDAAKSIATDAGLVFRCHLRQTEVEDLGMAALGQKDI